MSQAEDVSAAVASLPAFELEYGVDDPKEPTAVTVFAPDAEDVTTSWISMDARYVLSLEDVA